MDEQELRGARYSVIKLNEFFEHPDPGFICANPFGNRRARYVARVRHVAGPPAARDDLLWLRSVLGPPYKPFAYLYTLHDGMRLFVPHIARFPSLPAESDGGFACFPLAEVRQSQERLAKQYGSATTDDGTPVAELLAFAEVPASGNLICIRSSGPRRGELAELNHDAPPGGFGLPPKLDYFLALLRGEPEFFFIATGGYTFYSDGRTDAQWRPIRYVEDCRALTSRQIGSEPLPDWLA